MSKKLFSVVLLLGLASMGFALVYSPEMEAHRSEWTMPVEEDGGSVGWVVKQSPLTDWYYMYNDQEPGPPFNDPLLPAIPTFQDITGAGSKLAPHNDQPWAYTMPDSFWYFGGWYEPGDELWFSPDGWLSFDDIDEQGYPYPPTIVPPFPVDADPNAVIAGLWQDNNPLLTPDPSDNNRQWYYYDVGQSKVVFQWHNVEGDASGTIYRYQVALDLGGQEKLVVQGACGIVFSYHFIHWAFSSSSDWDGDNGEVGFEDQTGDYGIWYDGPVANGREARAGYKRVFKNDVQAWAFISPGSMTLRYTDIEPQVIVRNIGEEAEDFSVTLKIYDEDLVYDFNLAGFYLVPGAMDTLVAPCWTPGEIGTLYEKYAFTQLERDSCKHNDTVMETTYIHCDDTFRYDWNEAVWEGWGFSGGSPPAVFMAWYGVNNGVLTTGGRGWITNIYGDQPMNIQVYSANGGCGATVRGNLAGQATTPTLQAGWNYAEFPGVGFYAPSSSPGNIFAGMSPAAYPCGYMGQNGLLTWPAPHPCYMGPGPGRGANFPAGSNTFYWGAYYGGFGGNNFLTPRVELFVHLGFGPFPLSPQPSPPCYFEEPHDVSCYSMEAPDDDYVEADVPITPELAIANIGRQAEPGSGFFPVKFLAIEEATMDTTYNDSAMISHIGFLNDPGDDPDTLFVALPPWTPDGLCEHDEPFVYYELIGLVKLGEVGPDDSDHCPYNDTVRRFVTSLLSHDVGVTDLVLDPEPDAPPDIYDIGTSIVSTATVENFGYDEEHNIPVRCEVVDQDSLGGGVLLWHNIQSITFLNWRGNILDEPYTADVVFPAYVNITDHHQTIEARTELIGDMCPDDDFEVVHINSGVAEENIGLPFALEITSFTNAPTVSFAVPYSVGVSVKVYDISGQLVTTLVDGNRTPGAHSVTWDAASVAKGIYLVRMESENFSATKKLVIW